MRKFYVLCVLVVFCFSGCITANNEPPLLVDFPDSFSRVDSLGQLSSVDDSEYYVVKVTKDKRMTVLGTVWEVYPDVFTDGEGLPSE